MEQSDKLVWEKMKTVTVEQLVNFINQESVRAGQKSLEAKLVVEKDSEN